jgi:hypothetical protein
MAKANGKSCITLRTAICMKATTNLTRKMDREFSLGRVAMFTKAAIGTMNVMGSERCTGLMGLSTRDSGAEGSSMGKER